MEVAGREATPFAGGVEFVGRFLLCTDALLGEGLSEQVAGGLPLLGEDVIEGVVDDCASPLSDTPSKNCASTAARSAGSNVRRLTARTNSRTASHPSSVRS